MFLLIHATAGMIIGETVKRPLWAFLIGLACHFIFDMIPHGDSRLYKNYKNGEMKKRAVASVTVDSVLTILWILFATETLPIGSRSAVTAGIAGSAIPDLLVGLSETFKKIKALAKFQNFHIRVHNLLTNKIKKDWPWVVGLTFQICILAILMTLVK